MKLMQRSAFFFVLCVLTGSAAAQSSDSQLDADVKERAKIKEYFDSNPVPNSTMKRWSVSYPDGKVCESVADIPHCEAPRQQGASQNFAFTVVCTTKAGAVTRSNEPRAIPAECR